MEKVVADKIIGIPSRLVVPYTVPTLIKHFDFFNKIDVLKDKSFTSIQREFNVDPRVLDAVLTYLLKEGFVEKSKNKQYLLTPMSKEFLLNSGSYNLSPFVLILDGNIPDKIGDSIAFALKTGQPAKWDSKESWKDAMRSGAISKVFSEGMMSRGKYLSSSLSSALKSVLSKRKSLVDIGGSLGDYCGRFTTDYPKLNCTVFDLPKVIENTKLNIAKKGYKRVNTVSGDMFKGSLPKGHDVHLYSNVMHDWTAQQILVLLKKSYVTLEKEGIVIIHDLHLENTKKGPEVSVDHSLYLSVFTEGKCYTYGEMTELLKNAGFKQVKIIKTVVGYSAIIAKK